MSSARFSFLRTVYFGERLPAGNAALVSSDARDGGDVKQLTDINHLLLEPSASSSMIFSAMSFGLCRIDRSPFSEIMNVDPRICVRAFRIRIVGRSNPWQGQVLCLIISLRRSLRSSKKEAILALGIRAVFARYPKAVGRIL